jgi:hypothetical protein
LSFKHVLTHEAVYQTLLRPQREEYHTRIAQAIETLSAERLEEVYEVLAHHYVRSGQKDKAVAYLALANQKAAKVNAMTEAKQYFESAMALLDTLPDTEDISGGVSCWCPNAAVAHAISGVYDLCNPMKRWQSGWATQDSRGAVWASRFCEWWFGCLGASHWNSDQSDSPCSGRECWRCGAGLCNLAMEPFV